MYNNDYSDFYYSNFIVQVAKSVATDRNIAEVNLRTISECMKEMQNAHETEMKKLKDEVCMYGVHVFVIAVAII